MEKKQKNVKEVFNDYLNALGSQKWEDCLSYFHDDATVFFREGSYYGKFQIKVILQNTFSIIKDEKIEEFAQSSYFETYKKLFKELGIS